ncbi:hypothetical protein DM860_002241 [Cuscuta australis]|uniref:Uncharacterized protein n=1 Tax=Cuscuta australis TaxID=267555 RepID=A0A328DXK7_9ASTE|nr:hypothetical protein DM860_002241 [Cuscuta australis]
MEFQGNNKDEVLACSSILYDEDVEEEMDNDDVKMLEAVQQVLGVPFGSYFENSLLFAMSRETPTSLNLCNGPSTSLLKSTSYPKSVNSNDWGGLDPYEFCRRRRWSSVKPPPTPPNPYDDFSAAFRALLANHLPSGEVDWDAP